MKAVIIIACVAALFGVVALSGKLIGARQQLEMERSDIQARWTQLDKDMEREADLIPAVLTNADNAPVVAELTEAHNAYVASKSKQEKMRANSRLSSAVPGLLALGLPAGQDKQDELADAQQAIANDKEDYNDAIKRYNTDLQLFPRNLVGFLFGFEREDGYYPTPKQPE